MKARALIDGAAFEPATLRVVKQAFDAAWAEIAPAYGSDPVAIENARLDLARAVLSVASEDSIDVDALKVGALEALAGDYRVGRSKSDA